MTDHEKRDRAAGWVVWIGVPLLAAVWLAGITGWLPIAESAPCEVQRLPTSPPSQTVGELAQGQVFELAVDGLYMRVGPAHGYNGPPAPAFPDGWELPAPGEGRVWVVDLADGTLTRMPGTWRAWPVARAKVTAGTTHP
jgi:hypothetical protein